MNHNLSSLSFADKFIPVDNRYNTKRNPEFFASAFDLASNHFKTVLLDPVNRKIPNYILNEKRFFVVVIVGTKDLFVGLTLDEALDLSGYTIENIPNTLFAFEFQSEKNWINYRYCFDLEPGIPSHGMNGKFPCSVVERGLFHIIGNPETYKFR